METFSAISILSRTNAILLLDDEADIVATIEQMALKDFRINSKQYSLVISDIKMPQINGYEFIKEVKEIKPEVNVIFMTAFGINELELERVIPSIRIDELVEKPISAKDLVGIIDKYVKNETKLKHNLDFINNLNLPVGLMELIVSHGLTIQQLVGMRTSDLAEKLGIDQDAARLIFNAVRERNI